jgi:peroxiredoxin
MTPKDVIPRLTLSFLVLTLSVSSCGESRETNDEAEGTAGALQIRMQFPYVELMSVEGDPVNTKALMRDRESLVFFVSLSCEACEELIQTWMDLKDEIPPDLNLFAVTDEEVEFARDFLQQNPFPFPLYCDVKNTFGDRYEVDVFPTVVGTSAEGRIAFLGKAVTPLFTPEKAMAMFGETTGARDGS